MLSSTSSSPHGRAAGSLSRTVRGEVGGEEKTAGCENQSPEAGDGAALGPLPSATPTPNSSTARSVSLATAPPPSGGTGGGATAGAPPSEEGGGTGKGGGLVSNTCIMVILSDGEVASNLAAIQINIDAAKKHFERFIPRSGAN